MAFEFVTLLGTDITVHIAQAEYKALKPLFPAVGKKAHLEIDFRTVEKAPERHYILRIFLEILDNDIAKSTLIKNIAVFITNKIITD